MVVNAASFVSLTHGFSNTILCPPLSAGCSGTGRGCTRVPPALGIIKASPLIPYRMYV